MLRSAISKLYLVLQIFNSCCVEIEKACGKPLIVFLLFSRMEAIHCQLHGINWKECLKPYSCLIESQEFLSLETDIAKSLFVGLAMRLAMIPHAISFHDGDSMEFPNIQFTVKLPCCFPSLLYIHICQTYAFSVPTTSSPSKPYSEYEVVVERNWKTYFLHSGVTSLMNQKGNYLDDCTTGHPGRTFLF